MERIDEMFREAIQFDSSMNDVREYMDHKKTLQQHGLTHDDEVEFLTYVRQSPAELADLIVLFGHWRQKNLRIDDLLAAHSNLIELRQLGYSTNIFTELKLAAKGFDPQSLLKGIILYKNLQAIETELKKVSTEVQAEVKRLEVLKGETSKLETHKAQIEPFMAKHAKLTAQGFTEQIYDLLLNVAKNYDGVENLLKGLDAYQNLQQLLSRVITIQRKCVDSESRLTMLNSQYADLQTVIAMCNFLLKERKMSIPFISQLVDVAKQYGDPQEILKMVSAIGGLQNLEKKRAELLSDISEKEMQKISSNEELNIVKQQLVTMMGDIKAVEQELNLARIIYAVTYFPKQDIELALKYAILIVGASKNLCIGGKINPKIRVGSVFPQKYSRYAYAEFEAIDLMELLLRALMAINTGVGAS